MTSSCCLFLFIPQSDDNKDIEAAIVFTSDVIGGR